MFGGAFQNKTVWLSGHTGFKGAWLAQWLLQLGARVHGYALTPPTNPSLFEQLQLEKKLVHTIADIRDDARVRQSIKDCKPDFVFHLAAQPLVRDSYAKPLETYQTNVMGTVHVLEALRGLDHPCTGILVTTDKCYENREWLHGYREEDALGGHDPYSSSKAAAEMAIAGYRRSFFGSGPVKIASARAGNVIGGGDWATDRIVPDCIRALQKQQPIPVRNKTATRPWQHVLEPLSGYLWLAAVLAKPQLAKHDLSRVEPAFNFGPTSASNRTVAELAGEVLKHWPGKWEDRSDPKAVHEANLLMLSTDKAHALLRWVPVWNFTETIAATVTWYRQVHEGKSADLPQKLTTEQIAQYAKAAAQLAVPWAME